ncbi:Subtilisin-like protease SBT1.8 [Thalictrum thalictroides]|uniref:Subtilisin-like protease SBT1.8 n=1 Tax=Thalictrum thalictroides TaxID=46969 RepID=A0A7J6US61_THATH|nr:Subtilisin-like protease SBT1.8 [Thalictrum thalictroides]
MNHHHKPLSYATHHDWYIANLQSLSSDPTTPSLLYTYSTAYHGFAASLDSDQVESLRRSDSVFGVYEDTIYNLHTTRTPEFLGLETNLGIPTIDKSKDIDQASMDVIIGVLDTGVWPESKSFDDSKMSPIPSNWKGECESGPDFSPSLCNKKLIGARSFSKGFRMSTGGGTGISKKPSEEENVSPRDIDGHGTHTASTAAGSHVSNASLLGYATGTARGMAIQARVAAYKVCWKTGCFGSDILAGMDQAILDGVHVLSLSLGGGSGPYYRDTIAIGAFTAVEKGIFVSCSAGNSGPSRASLANVAPWIATVGAGTLDRDFPAFALLGNGKNFAGVSLYSGSGMGTKPVSIVYSKGNNTANLCLAGSLEPSRVQGKIVLCDRGINARVDKGVVVRDAGGIGMILANTAASGEELVADSHLIPAVAVGRKIGDLIRAYVQSDSDPTAVLSFAGTVLNVRPSPVLAAFSSRGPNLITPQILKPDMIGPGVNILAAWSEAVAPTGLANDTRRSRFNIMSGTSMSCPHISGLAALLKAAHPDWSPSAIKSALMTTAYVLDNTKSALLDAATGSVSTPWAHGSGHVDPQKALDPGLVYDISTEDYIAFLCSLDYGIEHVKAIVKRPNITCSRKFADPGQLNYPSFSVSFGKKRVVRYTRILTNVGLASSVYNVNITGPANIVATVKPMKLVYNAVGQKLGYTITFVSKRGSNGMGGVQFGSIVWKSALHQVRSPISYEWSSGHNLE